jgi:hypothetical protein
MFSNDIIGELLSYVETKEKIRLGHICKDWLYKSKSNFVLDTKEFPLIKGTPDIINFIKDIFIKWKSKDLEKLVINGGRQKISLELLKMLDKHTKVKMIGLKDYSGVTDKSATAIWDKLKYLEHIELSTLNFPIISERLKSITIIGNMYVPNIVTPNLQSLTLNSHSPINLITLLQTYPQLTYLSVNLPIFTNNDILDDELRNIKNPKLKTLILKGAYTINFKIFNTLLSKFKLEELELTIDDIATNITIHSERLNRLKVDNYNTNYTNVDIKCPNLKHCNIPNEWILNNFELPEHMNYLKCGMVGWDNKIEVDTAKLFFIKNNEINIKNSTLRYLDLSLENSTNIVSIQCNNLKELTSNISYTIDTLLVSCKRLETFNVNYYINSLFLSSNNITSITLDDNINMVENLELPNLKYLYLSTFIDIESLYKNCKSITTFSLKYNKCSCIDFSNFTNLKTLNIFNIKSKIDIKHPNLKTLTISDCGNFDNKIDCPLLECLKIYKSYSSNIDFSKCLNLYKVKMTDCENLTSSTLNNVNYIKINRCNNIKDVNIITDVIFKCVIIDCNRLNSVRVKCHKIGKLKINTDVKTYIDGKILGKFKSQRKPIILNNQ